MIGAGCPVFPCQDQCQLPVAPSFTSSFVTFLPAIRCFISAATVIAARVIAAAIAGKEPAACSATNPIAVMNRVSAPKREDHRARQRAYRQRLKARVTDQSS